MCKESGARGPLPAAAKDGTDHCYGVTTVTGVREMPCITAEPELRQVQEKCELMAVFGNAYNWNRGGNNG